LHESWPAIWKSPILLRALALWLAPGLLGPAICFSQDATRSGSPGGEKAATGAQQAFAANCAGCHGLDGKGGERAPDIVTRPNIRQLSDAQLFEILQKGVPRTSMPPFRYLGDPALRSLVAHLRTLQGHPEPANLPGNAKQGKLLFFGKAGCSSCHMARGEGGFFASDLTAYSRGRSPEAIHDAIVFPNRDLDPRNRTVIVTLPGGKSIEGLARNEDNFSIQLLTRDGAIHLLNKSALSNLSYGNQSPMPADYGTRLSAAEVQDLVNYLDALSKEEARKDGNKEDEDED
jgi:putative heme-binding domain-containing protein